MARKNAERRAAAPSAGGQQHGGGLPGRRHRLPEELGALSRSCSSAPSCCRSRRPGRAEGAGEGVPGQQRPLQELGVHRGQDEAAPHEGKALYMHCLPADITGVSLRGGRGQRRASSSVPHRDLPGGRLQALRHRRDDPGAPLCRPGAGAGPGAGRRPPALRPRLRAGHRPNRGAGPTPVPHRRHRPDRSAR